jgi:hypothetical protein
LFDELLIVVLHVGEQRRKPCPDLISDVLPFGRLWYGEPNAVHLAATNAANLSGFSCLTVVGQFEF